MRYASVRNQIKSGDLFLFHGRGLIAGTVRLCTDSVYAHVALAWVIGGRVLMIESQIPGGVQIHALSTRLCNGASWLPTGIPLTDQRLYQAMLDLDDPYSVLNCLRALKKLPGVDGQFECAQLAATVLNLPGVRGWTPQGIRDFFANVPVVPLEA